LPRFCERKSRGKLASWNVVTSFCVFPTRRLEIYTASS
jgi:hypothetical protein